jgi:hypothetical protein
VDNIENMSPSARDEDATKKALATKKKQKWRAANKERVRTYSREWSFKYKYGITLAQYEEMKIEQGHRCAICGEHEDNIPRQKTRKNLDGTQNLASALVVDHCHNSGKVRKLLCFKCNQGLGSFKEDPLILEQALRYVREECS